jgi:hypothetical protein
MLDAAEQDLSAETLRRIAHDLVRLDLSDDEVTALVPVLRGLLNEIGHIGPVDRDGAEPEVGLVLESWPHG